MAGGEQAGKPCGAIRAWAIAFGLIVSLALVPRAEALVYWADEESNTIARANLDGTGLEQDFLAVPGFSPSYGLASSGSHLYWANESTGDVGRAAVIGTGVDPTFISPAPATHWGVAASGSHVYWQSEAEAIGRANLDGDGVRPSFITGIGRARGLAAGRSHIYWASRDVSGIGRAKLDGSAPGNPSFLSLDCAPDFVALSTKHIYWDNACEDAIGRAKLNGDGVNETFIDGASEPAGIAVFGSHVYWANFQVTTNDGTIGRAQLDGDGADQSFLATPNSNPRGLAVDWIANTGARFRFGRVTPNRRRGIASLALKMPGPGTVRLAGRGIRTARTGANAPQVKLRVKPRGALARKLRDDGRATASVTVRFAPKLSAGSKTKRKRITLKRR